MRSIVAIAIATACGSTGGVAVAAERQAQCKFAVEGKTYIDGRCSFRAIGSDGSFSISDDVRSVYVSIDGKTAEGSWNKDLKSTHADWPLGTLTRSGACWTNATAQICARNAVTPK